MSPPPLSMDSVSDFPPGFVVVQVSGPLILAYLGDWGLFGALTAFPNDRPYIDALVYIVYSLQLVQTVMTAADALRIWFFGSGFGNYMALTAMHVSWFSSPIVGVFNVWLIGSALIDVIIALSTTYYVRESSSACVGSHPAFQLITRDTGLRVIDRYLLMFVYNTFQPAIFLLTALVALAKLVLYFAFPDKSYEVPHDDVHAGVVC
ncbi:hypothetical protein DFH07DRAFT_967652 [Mycena maculata]|uniref:Transmembrane protein n=1 Tax=Mycena maculata TaxID=230809 RepID=A0AAD7MVV7_9AGAR|nr:hypothetical protein DFH07DRAFT_967652 [Mycena maculata]